MQDVRTLVMNAQYPFQRTQLRRHGTLVLDYYARFVGSVTVFPSSPLLRIRLDHLCIRIDWNGTVQGQGLYHETLPWKQSGRLLSLGLWCTYIRGIQGYAKLVEQLDFCTTRGNCSWSHHCVCNRNIQHDWREPFVRCSRQQS